MSAAIALHGFLRGAVVRRHGAGPNMLVIRSWRDFTVVAVVEGPKDGQMRLREYPTPDFVQVTEAGEPREGLGFQAAAGLSTIGRLLAEARAHLSDDLQSLLESHCLLDADLKPRRETLDAADPGAADSPGR